MPKRWITVPSDEALARPLASALRLPLPLARVLVSRDLADAARAREFMNPRLADLPDPSGLPQLEPALARVQKALRGKEPIVVFGDYDADGVTAAALLTRTLRRLGAAVTPFLPLRLDEGYGLTSDALDRCLAAHHPKLIITVDCGTASVESVEAARRAGVDVIVTDHHEPSGALAPAAALVNPKCGAPGALTPLAGVGVAFMLCLALARQAQGGGRGALTVEQVLQRLDLVALGTVADVVPLTGVNRLLVRFGLEALNTNPLPGLMCLSEAAGVRGPVGEYHLGFVLGPRLNAAGRMADARAALELLLTEDFAVAEPLASQLNEQNRNRQELEVRIKDEALAMIRADYDPSRDLALVVARRDWHPGVIGIVASRITSEFGRPAILVALDGEGTGRGSGRSVEGFNLVEQLGACAEHLVKFGGHAMAAGLELREESLPAFREALNRRVAGAMKVDDLQPVQKIHAWLELGEADRTLLNETEKMRPFGFGNPRPVWGARQLRVIGSPRIMGGKHLRLTLASGATQISAIAFNCTALPAHNGLLDAAFNLQLDTYGGRESLQLNIQDLRSSE